MVSRSKWAGFKILQSLIIFPGVDHGSDQLKFSTSSLPITLAWWN